MEGFLGGIHGSPFHGPSVEFRDYRDYQPGDDLRHLDWRLYARSDRLCVKRYQQETNARCYVVCDTSASMGYRGAAAWASKIECARTIALALGGLLLRQNDAVGLLAARAPEEGGPRLVRPARHPMQLAALRRELGALDAAGGAVLADLLAVAARVVHRRSLLLVLSDLLDPAPEVALGFERLRFDGHECVVVQVLDRDEIEFPFEGSRLFEDPESGLRRRVDAGRAREAYRARFDAFMEEHRQVFRRLEVAHQVIRTDEDPGRALARMLAAHEGRR
jgi:uncharacterized protein (DUF58 family)